jgi:hypothetical protein
MQPRTPVVSKDVDYLEVVFARDQKEYLPLPAIRFEDGRVVSRWKLSLRERIKIFFTGSLWLWQLTFRNPLQPQLPSVNKPVLSSRNLIADLKVNLERDEQ